MFSGAAPAVPGRDDGTGGRPFEHGIVVGVAPRVVAPGAVVTRAQMAVVVATAYDAIAGAPYIGPTSHPFSDVHGHWAEARVAQLFGLGLAAGTSPTAFSPEDPVTRGEMAVFLEEFFLVALWESPPSPRYDAQPFPDVPPGHFAASGVGTISALGVTEGTSATTFSPDDAVTREQLAVFMNRLLEYSHGVRSAASSAASD